MKARTVPEHIQDDDTLAGRFKVRLSEALAECMDESEWKKFSLLHGLNNLIVDHPRFLRSKIWNDPDHEGLVLDLVQHLYEVDQASLLELYRQRAVQTWFQQHDPEFLETWEGAVDPLLVALGHGLEEVHEQTATVNLNIYLARIEAALPGDPSQAIGATKDMLEATMRTILHKRGYENVENLDYAALSSTCLSELGLKANSAPSSPEERYVRKIASSAKAMIDAANELRNAAGTGHGRIVGVQPSVSPTDASLVASIGLVLAAWMLRHSRAA